MNRRQKIYSDPLGRQWKREVLNWDGSVYSTTESTLNARDQATLVRQFQGPDTSGVYQDTTMTFDGYGRLQSKHVPEQNAGTATTYSYNNDDTINSVTDARGASATYNYNNRHLVTGINYSAPAGIPIPGPVSFGYDSAGNRTSMSDGSGSTSYQYDQLSRMISETRVINGLSGSYTIGYAYNLAGELKSLTDPQGRTVSYDHDSIGRLSNVTGSGYNVSQLATDFQYRAWGAVKHYSIGFNQYSGGSILGAADLSYNARLQLTHFELANPGSTYSPKTFNSNYQYYSDGRVKFIDDKLTSTDPSFPNSPPYEASHNFDRAYNYDHAARLTEALTGNEARGGTTADGPYKENYQYDVWDHMNARTNRIWSRPTDSFTANYINNRNHDPLSLWQYDADGNPTFDDNGWSIYDASGRKSSFPTWRLFIPTGSVNPNPSWNSGVANVTYDGNGTVVKETEDYGTIRFASYDIRSTVLGGASLLRIEVQTDNYYAPGWTYVTRVASTYAAGQRIAFIEVAGNTMDTTTNGNLTFEHSEPFTGVRSGTWGAVTPDPLGQEVGSYDPGPDDPGDVGQYPEPHEYGMAEDVSMGCTLDGITINCGTAMGLLNSGAAGLAPTNSNRAVGDPNNPGQRKLVPNDPIFGDVMLGAFWRWVDDGTRLALHHDHPDDGVVYVDRDEIGGHWEFDFNLPQNTGQKKVPCPPVPEHPADADIDKNIASAEGARHKSWTPIGPSNWFYNQVKNGGAWDYKQQGKKDGKNYEDFGNFNFGATALALNIWDEQTILREAGRAQIAAGTSRPEWGYPGSRLSPYGGKPPYGDDPSDQAQIKKGFAYYKAKDKGCQ